MLALKWEDKSKNKNEPPFKFKKNFGEQEEIKVTFSLSDDPNLIEIFIKDNIKDIYFYK